MRIAIQGEKGSFHEEAVKSFFIKGSYELVSCTSFDSTIDAIKQSRADMAVMAIENARSGSILYNYSLIRESGLKVHGEKDIRIRQNLMALPGQTIDNINEVWSHPVAISQCMNFLSAYPEIRLVEKDDTASSARIISNNEIAGVAAIGADIAAEIYKLNILASGIESYKMNYTRFLLVGVGMNNTYKANKASVCFSLGHKPGSLAKLLVILAAMNINLSKILSVPKINSDWEYLFYLDLEFNGDTEVEHMLKVIHNNTRELEVLGLYKI